MISCFKSTTRNWSNMDWDVKRVDDCLPGVYFKELMYFLSCAYYLIFAHLNDARFPSSRGANDVQKCERAEQNGRKRGQGGSVGSLKADRPTPTYLV